jgi:hypothetical protein
MRWLIQSARIYGLYSMYLREGTRSRLTCRCSHLCLATVLSQQPQSTPAESFDKKDPGQGLTAWRLLAVEKKTPLDSTLMPSTGTE